MHVYVLKRIGAPSTTGVPDVLRLEPDVTKFGREHGNDYVLDSTRHKCMISRKHAQILITTEGLLVINDSSLNGSYINDYKIDKSSAILREGDTIAFGHVNAQQIKAGEYAPQRESEFLFRLEKMSETDFMNYKNKVKFEHNNNSENNIRHMNSEGQLTETLPRPVLASFPNSENGARQLLNEQQSGFGSPILLNQSSQRSTGSSGSRIAVLPHANNSYVDYGNDSFEDSVTAVKVVVTRFCDGSSVSDEDIFAKSEISQANDMVTGSNETNQTNSYVPSTDHIVGVEIEDIVPESVEQGPSSNNESPHTTSSTVKRKNKNVLSTGKGPGKIKKRKSSTEKKPGTGKRGRKKKKIEDDDTWDEYDEECASIDCCKPNHAKVEWVQCDDCDQWYHMECVECNAEVLKRDNIEFHCGCM